MCQTKQHECFVILELRLICHTIIIVGIPTTEPNRIVNAFKNTFGYSSGGEVISYDFEKVYNSMYYGNPVILLGVGSNGGHAWVADGYKNVKIHVIEKKKFLGITISTKEYDIYKDYLHMNWGWNGESNGLL